jgi:hypothetical protein
LKSKSERREWQAVLGAVRVETGRPKFFMTFIEFCAQHPIVRWFEESK